MHRLWYSLVTPLFRWRGLVEPQEESGLGDTDVSAFAMARILLELHNQEWHGLIRLAAMDVPEDVDLSVGHGLPDHLNRCADALSEVTVTDAEVVIVDDGLSLRLDQHSMRPVAGDGRFSVRRGELFHPGHMVSRSGKVHQNIFPYSDGSVPVRRSLNCCVRCSVHDFLRFLSGVV